MKRLAAVIFLAALAANGAGVDENRDLGLKYLRSFISNPATRIAGTAFAIDDQGNSYSTGELHDTSHFGNTVVECTGANLLPPYQCRDLFIAKYDRQKALVWLKHAPNAGGTAIAAHGTNWIIVGGRILGNTRIADVEIPHAGKNRNAFLARYDDNGKAEWIHLFKGASDTDIAGVAVEPNGNILVTGDLKGPTDLSGTSLTAHGRCDGFLAKFTPDGKLLWVQQHDASNAQPSAVALDARGNGYVTGRFWGSFAGVKIRAGSGMYLIKYDPNGKVLWATNADSDVEVTHRRAPEGLEGSKVTVDREGNPYVTGFMGGTRQFGSVMIPDESPIYRNVFFARYTADGALEWVRQLHRGDGKFYGAVSLALAARLPAGKAPTITGAGNSALGAKAVSAQAMAAAAATPPSDALLILGEAGKPSVPPLRIFKSDTSVVLVWPATANKNVLEAAETLMPFPIWTPVSNAQVQEGSFVTVTLPIEGAAKFYRLRAP